MRKHFELEILDLDKDNNIKTISKIYRQLEEVVKANYTTKRELKHLLRQCNKSKPMNGIFQVYELSGIIRNIVRTLLVDK